MKLTAARDCYYSHPGNASAAGRQIAFAGIAVVWIFNQPQSGLPIFLPENLVIVLLLLCATLAFDLLQYALSAAIWGVYSRHKEKEFSHKFHEDPNIEPPHYLNWPGLAMFWLKLISLLCAYVVFSLFVQFASSIGCDITIHSSRSRFAARLNSGVGLHKRSVTTRNIAHPANAVQVTRLDLG